MDRRDKLPWFPIGAFPLKTPPVVRPSGGRSDPLQTQPTLEPSAASLP